MWSHVIFEHFMWNFCKAKVQRKYLLLKIFFFINFTQIHFAFLLINGLCFLVLIWFLHWLFFSLNIIPSLTQRKTKLIISWIDVAVSLRKELVLLKVVQSKSTQSHRICPTYIIQQNIWGSKFGSEGSTLHVALSCTYPIFNSLYYDIF